MIPPPGFAYRNPRRDGHWVLALIAVLSSVALHVLFLSWMGDMRLDASELVERVRAEKEERNQRFPPLRVERVPQDPFRPTSVERPDTSTLMQPAALEMMRFLMQLPELVSPLQPTTDAHLADTVPASSRRAEIPPSEPMISRQEIATVLEKRIDDNLAAMKRREVSLIERVTQAPDFAPAVDAASRRFEGGSGFRPADMPFGFAGFQTMRLPPPKSDPPQPSRPENLEGGEGTEPAAVLSERFSDPPEQAQHFVAVDDRLSIALQSYRDPGEDGRIYFRIAIQPRPEAPMPALPKDLLLVQDSSASLAEERLYFCRQALGEVLDQIGPSDRFNILAFSDQSALCFPDWVPATESTLSTARTFIGNMRSLGGTDLFASLQRVLKLPRDPARPLVAVIVTDGKPTVGTTASTEIIGAFTKLNDGAISVFGFGTHARINTYLLDMLTYCNRGETRLNRSGRWTIQKEIGDLLSSVRQPVMHDIRFAFDSASGSEVYPKQTTNLYADRPLELYGSCARDVRELVLQFRGRAGGSDYDAVIRLDIGRDSQGGDADLRARWAWQRMYHVIGLYARDPKPIYRAVMERLNADYGIPIPYGNEMGK